MKNTIITEFVKIEALQTTTNNQLMSRVEIINNFLQKKDGFIDAELIKAVDSNIWYIIYHIENMEKLKAVGEKLRSSKLFDQITPLIVPGSLYVSFYGQIQNWV
jgi:hypothetical protein